LPVFAADNGDEVEIPDENVYIRLKGSTKKFEEDCQDKLSEKQEDDYSQHLMPTNQYPHTSMDQMMLPDGIDMDFLFNN
jgi:hypothetical protein